MLVRRHCAFEYIMHRKNLLMMQAQNHTVLWRITGKVIRNKFLYYKWSKNNHSLGRQIYSCTDRKICTLSHRYATILMTMKIWIFMAQYTESKLITHLFSRVHRLRST